MIRINLLPFRAARKKENVRRQVSIFILSFILVAMAVVLFNFRLSGKITRLNEQIEATKVQVAKYNEINKEIEAIKQELDILNKKILVIETLEANRRDAITLLDAMTKLIVIDRMWFTLMRSKEAFVDVTGIALDNRGWIYVSDSYMELIQVFDSGYEFKHVLGQGHRVHKFMAPTGLAIDAGNRLYVTQMLGNKVSVYELR